MKLSNTQKEVLAKMELWHWYKWQELGDMDTLRALRDQGLIEQRKNWRSGLTDWGSDWRLAPPAGGRMMSEKHTPGPRVVDSDPWPCHIEAGGKHLAKLGRFSEVPIEEAEANAELIARAHELLEENARLKADKADLLAACEVVMDSMKKECSGCTCDGKAIEFENGCNNPCDEYVQLRAAIAKAKEVQE